ncbi:unnamed protein product [Protopolystoma xenopodis]|uniref:Uncharacterized protein n=1 Tax=Protopolystoma xenopodis TaxID=117903 RepID=A0A3S5AWP4_9PLAT|nr:unnamed protein product [Protopolystoma xenopodis]
MGRFFRSAQIYKEWIFVTSLLSSFSAASICLVCLTTLLFRLLSQVGPPQPGTGIKSNRTDIPPEEVLFILLTGSS